MTRFYPWLYPSLHPVKGEPYLKKLKLCYYVQDLNIIRNLAAALCNKFFMGWGSPFVIHKKEKKERIQKNE